MTYYFNPDDCGFYHSAIHGARTRLVPDPKAVPPEVDPDDPESVAAAEGWVPPFIEEANPDCQLPENAVEISDELHAFLINAERQGKTIQAGEGGQPIVKDREPDPIDEVSTRACRAIDQQAEATRALYLTPGDGQAMTYQAKEAEAYAIVNDAAPDAANYPMLAAMIGLDGDTLEAVAETIRERAEAWRLIGAEIERIRQTAKQAVKAAESHEEIDLILDGLTWPEPD